MQACSSYQNEFKHLYQKGDRLYTMGLQETALKTFQKALDITELINTRTKT